MDLGLDGRRALVLAASRGLGLGVATALVAEGAQVLVTGRDEGRLQRACERLNAAGPGRATYLAVDQSRPSSAKAIARAATARLGSVDILVNNTGGPPPGPIAGIASDVWANQFDAMVRTVVDLTNAVLPDMRARNWGRILTIASSGVVQPIPNLGLSNTLRAALVGWSKTLADEVAADGVTVNVLAPGRIHTERVDELDAAAAARGGWSVEAVAEASRVAIPLKRYGRVEEFADVAAFLVSARASYVTGSVVRCDGGSIRSV